MFLCAGALLIAGCANPFSRNALDNFSITYRINIQQGMVITQEMSDQLKPGMTRDQVRFVLGTPILTDPFHANRWDYPFRFQPGRGRIEERHFSVYFENDMLARIESDKLPTEAEFAESRNFATTRIVRNVTGKLPNAPSPVPASGPSDGLGGNASAGTDVSIPIKRPQGVPNTSSTDSAAPAPPDTTSTPR